MHGRGFGDAPVHSVYWQNCLVSRGGVPMNPTMCRQVFVDERQSIQCCSWTFQSRGCYW